MTWTHFMDMHSGGGTKEEPFEHIYIEAPEAEARVIFYNRFGHSPERVSCTCCGGDYSISEHATLKEATAYERGCASVYYVKGTDEEVGEGFACAKQYDRELQEWVDEKRRPVEHRYVERKGTVSYAKDHRTLEAYLQARDVLVVRADEIQPSERTGEVPEQGYVWAGG